MWLRPATAVMWRVEVGVGAELGVVSMNIVVSSVNLRRSSCTSNLMHVFIFTQIIAVYVSVTLGRDIVIKPRKNFACFRAVQ